jgi:hypothetical protein
MNIKLVGVCSQTCCVQELLAHLLDSEKTFLSQHGGTISMFSILRRLIRFLLENCIVPCQNATREESNWNQSLSKRIKLILCHQSIRQSVLRKHMYVC